MLKKYCTIAKPFSANKMYTPVAYGKLIKSKKYREWIENNLSVVAESMLPADTFPIDVEILVMADSKWKMKNDSDNLIKPIVDLLVRAKIVPNDTTRYINSIKVRYLHSFWEPTVCISYVETE
jgi:Holliday junction resolvase RusA-like endonuclease